MMKEIVQCPLGVFKSLHCLSSCDKGMIARWWKNFWCYAYNDNCPVEKLQYVVRSVAVHWNTVVVHCSRLGRHLFAPNFICLYVVSLSDTTEQNDMSWTIYKVIFLSQKNTWHQELERIMPLVFVMLLFLFLFFTVVVRGIGTQYIYRYLI